MTRANCLGRAPNLRKNPEAVDPWFPRKGESTAPGKIVCFTCHVRDQCADYRDRTGSDKYGMWAGEIKERRNGISKKSEQAL